MENTGRKILIVEDEPDLREFIVELLQENHANIYQAENGKVALEMLQKDDFHLVISDIKMPLMNGINLLCETKTQGLLIPFILITGSDDKKNLVNAIRLGAVDFLAKPFSPKELVDSVLKALEIETKRRELQRILNSAKDDKVVHLEKMIRLLGVSNFKKKEGQKAG
ncbi:MAG: response regulator [Pseudobdellovibrionaceae bacterium]